MSQEKEIHWMHIISFELDSMTYWDTKFVSFYPDRKEVILRDEEGQIMEVAEYENMETPVEFLAYKLRFVEALNDRVSRIELFNELWENPEENKIDLLLLRVYPTKLKMDNEITETKVVVEDGRTYDLVERLGIYFLTNEIRSNHYPVREIDRDIIVYEDLTRNKTLTAKVTFF